jgi:hypothetical protein
MNEEFNIMASDLTDKAKKRLAKSGVDILGLVDNHHVLAKIPLAEINFDQQTRYAYGKIQAIIDDLGKISADISRNVSGYIDYKSNYGYTVEHFWPKKDYYKADDASHKMAIENLKTWREELFSRWSHYITELSLANTLEHYTYINELNYYIETEGQDSANEEVKLVSSDSGTPTDLSTVDAKRLFALIDNAVISTNNEISIMVNDIKNSLKGKYQIKDNIFLFNYQTFYEYCAECDKIFAEKICEYKENIIKKWPYTSDTITIKNTLDPKFIDALTTIVSFKEADTYYNMIKNSYTVRNDLDEDDDISDDENVKEE